MNMTHPEHHIDSISLFFRNMGLPLLVVLVSAAIVFAIWYYTSTVPAVSGWKKRTVIALRAVALIVLIIGFAEPVLNIVTTFTRQDVTAVLLDTSLSMNLPQDPTRKQDALDALNTIRSNLGNRGVFFAFDDRIRTLESGEPEFTGAATDIHNAIHNAGTQREVSSIILISDGRWNLGRDPINTGLPESIPIHTVLVGSGKTGVEVVLKRISVPPVGREGSTLPVEIIVASSVESPDPMKVEILENNRTVAEGTLTFGEGTQARITFGLLLEKPGNHMVTATIKPVNDTLYNNNSRFFNVYVIKNSFRVLLVAAAPSADLAFIRRVIESDPGFKLQVVVDRAVITTPENAYPDDLSGFDALIILDGGGSAITSARAEKIVQWVSKGGGLWFSGSSPLKDEASSVKKILPVTFFKNARQVDSDFHISLTDHGRIHFITSGGGDLKIERDWNVLPPLSSILPISNVSGTGRVLAQASGKSARVNILPVMITGKHGFGKVLVTPISGIWRWRLMMEGAGKGGEFFDTFVMGTLRWLTAGIETSPLTVTTDSQTYLSGEEVGFEGRLFDNVYMPVSGADVSLIIDDNPALKVFLEETGSAVYTGTIRSVEPGEHVFKSTAFVGDTRFAESSGTFLVENFSLETLDSTPDPELLGIIAARTGGMNVTSAGIDSIFTMLAPHITTERVEEDHHVYLNPIMPALALAFLVVEWVIRKRRGMI